MAAASAGRDPVKDLCEEVICSLCLEYFKDPVILECGHNFCQECLTQYWGKLDTIETSCPQCREKVLQRNLRPNRQLANVVEITKKLSLQVPRRAESKEPICGKHQMPLKFFCEDDETCICVSCSRSKEHQDHKVVLPEKAAQAYKDLMAIRQDVLEKETEKILAYKAETEKEGQDLLKQTKAETEKTLAEIREVRQFLEEREKYLQSQMEELKKQIIRKRDENLVIFSRELSSLKSLTQEMKKKCQQPPAELLQDLRNLLQRSEEKETFEKPMAYTSTLKWKIWEFCDLNTFLVAVMRQFRDALLPGLQLQKANVTLDSETAGPWLVLAEDRKSVRYEDKRHALPDNPERFSERAYVLGHEGFTTGRHFWEVSVETAEEWFVGVTTKSVRRKGSINIIPPEGIWAVGKWKDTYMATPHPSSSVLSLSEKTKRVRVSLNCAINRVAFYDADTGAQIYILSEIPFSGETVLPFFYVFKKGHLKISP